MTQPKLTKREKIEHIQKCEIHQKRKDGECPIVSNKEAQKLNKEVKEIQTKREKR